MANTSPTIASIRSTLERRTLVVGTEAAITSNFPDLADELLDCDNVKFCGELSETEPERELWQRIDASQAERLWIIGGDGTINLVGECLLRHDFPLPCYLTPAGTANDLARAIAEHAAAGPRDDTDATPLALDLLAVTLDDSPDLKCCANMFTLGSSARNTQHVTEDIKARWGAFAYLSQFWKAIGDLEPFSIELAVGQGDKRTVENVLNMFIANGPYCGGGHRVAPPAKLDDGLMDAVILRQGSTAALAHIAASFLAGGHLEHELVEHFSGQNLTIECSKESPLTLDGEAFAAKRIAIRVVKNFLPITLVPKH